MPYYLQIQTIVIKKMAFHDMNAPTIGLYEFYKLKSYPIT
jgi:hypothetical protein